MRESIDANRGLPITAPRASIDGFPSTLTTCGSVMADTCPARPIVARCGFSGPDRDQGRMRCAPPADRREKHRLAALRGPSGLDSRAMRTTLEDGCGPPVGRPVRTCVFEPADARKTP
ncbi:hypothetical protein A8D61_01550 [Burkholderia cenocepacia]|nr:hypothetical protein A8D61_01550 [Burkholderia cenocepacia]AQQ46302.1 hypothetical protein A8F32_10690 [Burkholderia cenocepacia]ONI96597.1 hypothetical protein A8F33_30605 [Burkholderia cenocepacia]ONJ01120.1 hypothetical protein A8F53_13815 [Burkholderia cenocepacia]ONJ17600.1 hypothetical protein A8D82_30095 [Burkholderia cenocepacia]